MKQLAYVALLFLTGCASMSAQTGRPKGPDGTVVMQFICVDKDIEGAKDYLYARGLGYADVVERVKIAQKECK